MINSPIDCWVVPEEQFHKRVGWWGATTTFGIVIIPFGPRCKVSILSADSKVAKTYPCGWYARFPYDYAHGVKILGSD